jgi:hypothetical protein
MIDDTARVVAPTDEEQHVEADGANRTTDLGATMDADLDLLCISLYCTADDLLPEPRPNARRRLSDAEIVALCVAQVLMGIRATAASCARLDASWGPVPSLPRQGALHKRRARPRPTRWSGSSAPSPRRARARRPARLARLDSGRVWALARDGHAGARSSPGSAATATRAATRAGSGACACTWPLLRTAPRAQSHWSPATGPSARPGSGCSPRVLRGGETVGCAASTV